MCKDFSKHGEDIIISDLESIRRESDSYEGHFRDVETSVSDTARDVLKSTVKIEIR